jgi:hypothetical protein
MQTFYFNTGVRPSQIHNSSFPYDYHKSKGNIIRDDVLLLPFIVKDVPEGATFAFGCDDPNRAGNYIVREVEGGNLLSKYAYFTPKA